MQRKLEERKEQGLYRSLVCSNGLIDFASNDYLGFARQSILGKGSSNLQGATGSRLISGHSPEAERAEKKIASFHRTQAALIFNSGYMANIGLCSAIAGKNDTFVCDELLHASLIDGIRLSFAKRLKFKHNAVADLEQKLKKAKGNKFVVVESLYSMDGDEAPLKEMAEVCEQHKAYLIVDEAHATGVWGEQGEGLVCQLRLEEKVFAAIYTFGKALGLHGAAITGSETLRNYLINFARPFIYATALPPHTYSQIEAAYHRLPSANRERLVELIAYFSQATQACHRFSFLKSRSQIQGVVVPGNKQAKALADHLFQKGIYAKAILSPTVPAGQERIRICLHNFNTQSEIDFLLREIKNFKE
ncbi:MAG: 8-amino-7-oxononanoate synthase [Bacteroidetes bacterium]|nr:8-amino-7-oxononanoate synthase [Bacteroidota bacterium]